MKRITVIGALVLILAAFAGPAFAQNPADGSALPGPQTNQPLPDRVVAVPVTRTAATLPDTGIPVSAGTALGFGLLVVGGSVLYASRRQRATA